MPQGPQEPSPWLLAASVFGNPNTPVDIAQKAMDLIFFISFATSTFAITSSGRSAEATFEMLDTGDLFSFNHIPELDAYG
ncbi:hypothetical protein, partial [Bacillus salipaludis]